MKTQFIKELEALGATDKERAAVLGVNPKTVERLRRRIPENLIIFSVAPQLLRALADDFAASPQPQPPRRRNKIPA